MSEFNAAEYKKKLEESASCRNCEKIHVRKLRKGTPYIFISYSHEDYKKVYSDLADLYESDIPFWYDEDLTPGEIWSDEVIKRFSDPDCVGVIFYLSKSFFESESIKTEITMSITPPVGKPDFTMEKKTFSVNLSDDVPSKLIESASLEKLKLDAESQKEWKKKLLEKFSDSKTFLPFNEPNHILRLVEKIGVVFGIRPNYNPYDFGKHNFRSGNADIEFESGSVYEGSFVNSMFDGYGKITYADGSVYEGEWLKGNRYGQGVMKYSDGDVYEGLWINDIPNGQGTMKFSDGDVYEGLWANGIPNGQGTMTYHDGSVYTGKWLNGRMHGKGTMEYASGEVYTGSWKLDDCCGKGKCIYKNGDVYEGEWFESKKHGRGTLKYSDGDVYTGTWEKDCKNGRGKMTYSDQSVYEGEWKNDRKHGQGTMKVSNGDIYTGGWANDLWNGQGTLKRGCDGNSFTGLWINNKRNGIITVTFPDGNKIKIRFIDDKPIKQVD